MLDSLHIEGGVMLPADLLDTETASRAVAGSSVPYLDAEVPLAARGWASRMSRSCREYRASGSGTVAWVTLAGGKPVGAVVAKVSAPRAMIAYWVAEPARSQGWGRKQAAAAVAWLESEGIREVLADTERGNSASAALLSGLGFREADGIPAARRWRLSLDDE